MTAELERPKHCPHCDEDHIKAACLAPFGVYGGCRSARVAFDAGAASRQAEINRLKDALGYARKFDATEIAGSKATGSADDE